MLRVRSDDDDDDSEDDYTRAQVEAELDRELALLLSQEQQQQQQQQEQRRQQQQPSSVSATPSISIPSSSNRGTSKAPALVPSSAPPIMGWVSPRLGTRRPVGCGPNKGVHTVGDTVMAPRGAGNVLERAKVMQVLSELTKDDEAMYLVEFVSDASEELVLARLVRPCNASSSGTTSPASHRRPVATALRLGGMGSRAALHDRSPRLGPSTAAPPSCGSWKSPMLTRQRVEADATLSSPRIGVSSPPLAGGGGGGGASALKQTTVVRARILCVTVVRAMQGLLTSASVSAAQWRLDSAKTATDQLVKLVRSLPLGAPPRALDTPQPVDATVKADRASLRKGLTALQAHQRDGEVIVQERHGCAGPEWRTPVEARLVAVVEASTEHGDAVFQGLGPWLAPGTHTQASIGCFTADASPVDNTDATAAAADGGGVPLDTLREGGEAYAQSLLTLGRAAVDDPKHGYTPAAEACDAALARFVAAMGNVGLQSRVLELGLDVLKEGKVFPKGGATDGARCDFFFAVQRVLKAIADAFTVNGRTTSESNHDGPLDGQLDVECMLSRAAEHGAEGEAARTRGLLERIGVALTFSSQELADAWDHMAVADQADVAWAIQDLMHGGGSTSDDVHAWEPDHVEGGEVDDDTGEHAGDDAVANQWRGITSKEHPSVEALRELSQWIQSPHASTMFWKPIGARGTHWAAGKPRLTSDMEAEKRMRARMGFIAHNVLTIIVNGTLAAASYGEGIERTRIAVHDVWEASKQTLADARSLLGNRAATVSCVLKRAETTLNAPTPCGSINAEVITSLQRDIVTVERSLASLYDQLYRNVGALRSLTVWLLTNLQGDIYSDVTVLCIVCTLHSLGTVLPDLMDGIHTCIAVHLQLRDTAVVATAEPAAKEVDSSSSSVPAPVASVLKALDRLCETAGDVNIWDQQLTPNTVAWKSEAVWDALAGGVPTAAVASTTVDATSTSGGDGADGADVETTPRGGRQWLRKKGIKVSRSNNTGTPATDSKGSSGSNSAVTSPRSPRVASPRLDISTGDIQAANLNILVQFMTSEDAYSHAFTKMCLMMYPEYTKASALMAKLMQRYCVPDHVAPSRRRVIQMRVLITLKYWIDGQYPEEVLPQLTAFVEQQQQVDGGGERDPRSSGVGGVNKMREALRSALERQKGRPWRRLQLSLRVPEVDLKLLHCSGRSVTALQALLTIADDELAQQMTMLDWQLYERIQSTEFFRLAWSKPVLRQRSLNLLGLINRMNMISYWTSTMVLLSDTVAQRAATVAKFVRIATHLRRLNNFSSLMAVLAGLAQAPICRLRHTWAACDASVVSQHDTLQALMNPRLSYKAYRDVVGNATPPVIPYMGVSLSDLTFICEGGADVRQGFVKVNQLRLAHSVIESTLLFRQQPHSFPVVEPVRTMLQHPPHVPPKVLFDLSLSREPRGSPLPTTDATDA